MNHNYRLYNLTLGVPFLCPMLYPAPSGVAPDVTVAYGTVPRYLKNPIVKDDYWQAAPGKFLFRGGRFSGRFLVEDGERVTLYRNPMAKESKLVAHLLGAVMAALLRQRGQLVLHANATLTPRGAVVISGASGAGKSTAQAALLTRGCRMLTDDITILGDDSNGRIMVLPGVPKMSLCDDAAVKLGHDLDSLLRNPVKSTKVLVPVLPEDTLQDAVPLKAVYHIGLHHGDRLIIESLSGFEKFVALQECIYGPLFPEEHPGHFRLISNVASEIDIVRINRPDSRWSINEVVEAVLHG